MFPVVFPSPFTPSAVPTSLPSMATASASSMPSDVLANPQMAPIQATVAMNRDYLRTPTILTNPRLAPSTVTSEQAIQSRTLLTPQFQHNVMATRTMRISNLFAEAPRFRNQLDILA